MTIWIASTAGCAASTPTAAATGPSTWRARCTKSVHKMSWSQAQEVVKVIYLVGDAPPHTDYQDGYDYRARRARRPARGSQLHTIQCGNDHSAEGAWRKIASLGGGQYMAIHQDGGMQEEHSRYDDELATLHDKLGRTAIGFGAGGAGGCGRDGAAAERRPRRGQGRARRASWRRTTRRSAARATWSKRSRAARSSWPTCRPTCPRR